MNSLKKISDLAAKFEKKLQKLAQSAQSGDIDKALYDAGVRPTANDIGPLLNSAQVPENVGLNIQLLVDKNLGTRFNVVPSPAHPSAQSLANILNTKYTANMTKALKNSKLAVADTVTVPIATF